MSQLPPFGPGFYGTTREMTAAAAAAAAPLVTVAGSSRSYGRLGLILGIGGLSVAAVAGISYLLSDGDNSAIAAHDSEGNSSEEIQKPKVVLHQCPRGYTLPCISPFPLKLETFLRVAQIPYEIRISSVSDSDGRDPWLTLGEESVFQTYDCVPILSKVFGIDLEKGARGSRLTASRLVGVMLENRLYWGIAIWRWLYDNGESLASVQPVFPPEASAVVIAEVSESVRRGALYNGLGRRPFEEVVEIMSKDLADLSAALGKHPFFLGDTPGEVDCTAFAMLAQILWAMPNCPFQTELEKYPNLCEFLTRMREKFWKDWNEVLAKPEDAAGSQMSFIYPVHEFNLPTAQDALEGEFGQNFYDEGIDADVYRNLSAASTPARRRSTVSRRTPQVQFQQGAPRSLASAATVGNAANSGTEFDNLYQLLEEFKRKVDESEESAESTTVATPTVDTPRLVTTQAQTPLQETTSRHQAKQVENFNKLKEIQDVLDTFNQRLTQKNEKPAIVDEVPQHPPPKNQQSPVPTFAPPNNNQVFSQSQKPQPLQPGCFLQNPGMPLQQQSLQPGFLQNPGIPQQQYAYPPQQVPHLQNGSRSRPPPYYAGNVGMMHGARSRPDMGGMTPMGPVHYAPMLAPQPIYYNDMGMMPQYQNLDMTMPMPIQQQQYFQQPQHPQQYFRK